MDASGDVQHYKAELETLRGKLETTKAGGGGKGQETQIQLLTESIKQVMASLVVVVVLNFMASLVVVVVVNFLLTGGSLGFRVHRDRA